MIYTLLHQLLDLANCLYIEGRWDPCQSNIYALHIAIQPLYLVRSIQLSIDALQTTTPTVRSNVLHIYGRQMDPPVNQT